MHSRVIFLLNCIFPPPPNVSSIFTLYLRIVQSHYPLPLPFRLSSPLFACSFRSVPSSVAQKESLVFLSVCALCVWLFRVLWPNVRLLCAFCPSAVSSISNAKSDFFVGFHPSYRLLSSLVSQPTVKPLAYQILTTSIGGWRIGLQFTAYRMFTVLHRDECYAYEEMHRATAESTLITAKQSLVILAESFYEKW